MRLTEAFHLSGHRSVELKDIAGDSDFPELQGYFPVQGAGRLYFHFAFLTTDPAQELNVALAGPRFFQMEKDGIAFWLGTREGRLVHYSDSIPKRLFVPQAFAWYTVDVAPRRRRGTLRPRDPRRRARGSPRLAALAAERGEPAGLGGRQVLVHRDTVRRPLRASSTTWTTS